MDVPALVPPHAAPRADWIARLERIARPVLTRLAAGTLRRDMPVEVNPRAAGPGRGGVAHLEAVARLLSGMAPWLERDRPPEWLGLAARGLEAATDPASPDFLNFTRERQPLVDAAYLSLALLRAPQALNAELPARVRTNLAACLKATRVLAPYENNWLLFPAVVEAALAALGEAPDFARVDPALRRHDAWYLGDGAYGDGPGHHFDYYNSFAIHPMMLAVVEAFPAHPPCRDLAGPSWVRARRCAEVLERLVSPEGTYPLLGRSAAYRFGAFHALADLARRGRLPEGVRPAQVRCALGAVIRRQMDAPGTFDTDGWLRIGFAGAQPSLGEHYVSTGSLYLCATAFLPLGLAAGDPFWAAPDAPWTSVRAWSGADLAADRSLEPNDPSARIGAVLPSAEGWWGRMRALIRR